MFRDLADGRRKRAEGLPLHAPASSMTPQPASRRAMRLGVLGNHQGHQPAVRNAAAQPMVLPRSHKRLAQEMAGPGRFAAILTVLSEPATRLNLFA